MSDPKPLTKEERDALIGVSEMLTHEEALRLLATCDALEQRLERAIGAGGQPPTKPCGKTWREDLAALREMGARMVAIEVAEGAVAEVEKQRDELREALTEMVLQAQPIFVYEDEERAIARAEAALEKARG